jgi:hypothetical protein
MLWYYLQISLVHFLFTCLLVDWNFTSLTNYSILHTPWSRDVLEKLTSLQPVKKFPACY